MPQASHHDQGHFGVPFVRIVRHPPQETFSSLSNTRPKAPGRLPMARLPSGAITSPVEGCIRPPISGISVRATKRRPSPQGPLILLLTLLALLAGPSATWREVARIRVQPCEVASPSLAACPDAKSLTFETTGRPWRIIGQWPSIGFAGVWPADEPSTLVRHAWREIHGKTIVRYFSEPGRFFVFNSSIDQPLEVRVEEFR